MCDSFEKLSAGTMKSAPPAGFKISIPRREGSIAARTEEVVA
jgi:hypothetical protein